MAYGIQIYPCIISCGVNCALDIDEVPRLRPALRGTLVLAVPLAILIYTLFILNWNPGKAALIATVVALAIAYCRKETRLSLSGLVQVVLNAGRSMLPVGAVAVGAGIVVGTVHLTGSAFAFAMHTTQMGAGYLLLLLFITAIVCLLLGMGMPTTAIYGMMAVLVAPGLINLGVQPLAAHLFVFYFALMSFITWPVCIAIYIAAPMAGAPILKTALTAMRLGVVGFIVPFIFVLSPALLLQGSLVMLAPNLITALVGIILIAIIFDKSIHQGFIQLVSG